jgi:ABC-2 type transport system permease protein
MSARWFFVAARTSARRALADRSTLAVSVGFYIVVVAVISALWRAAADANGGEVAGYSAVALTWYLAASEASTVTLPMRMIEQIGDDIASGAVAVELLRPVPMLGMRIAIEIGRATPRLLVLMVSGIALASVVAGAPPDGAALVLAAPSLALAVSCNVVAQHAFAAAAFWVRDARSTWFLYQKLVFVVGGMLLPLEVLPGWLRGVSWSLPFAAMSYVPARLASGHVEPGLIGVQLAWLVALTLVTSAMVAAGQRRLQVVGG